MDNEADNTDITEGYANPDVTKPEEIVEEPQEAGEVQTECDFNIIVTGSRNEDIGEDVFILFITVPPVLCFVFKTPCLEIFHFCFRVLQQPKFFKFEPKSS